MNKEKTIWKKLDNNFNILCEVIDRKYQNSKVQKYIDDQFCDEFPCSYAGSLIMLAFIAISSLLMGAFLAGIVFFSINLFSWIIIPFICYFKWWTILLILLILWGLLSYFKRDFEK